jgi:non-heme chloroperoxidase
MASVREGKADSRGIGIRYLRSDAGTVPGLPVVFVPGITDFADDYLEIFDLFIDRPLVVIELRGRGGSDAPEEGYSAAELAGDIEAVLSAEGISRFHLMTFSRGTTPGLEVALASPGRVASISIGDYRVAEVALPPELVDQLWNGRWRGLPTSERIERRVLEAIQADSRSRPLWDAVADLGVPVLVVRGGPGSLVTGEVLDEYRRRLPEAEIVEIPDAGHDLFRPDRGAYPRAVLEFITRRAPGT